jgi:flagellar motor protein MotB
LQEQIGKLQQENDDLRSRLAQAISERDQARNRVAALERENADLRAQLASKPPAVELPDDWKRSGPYAWTELSTDFLFDSGKATLRSAARAKLQQVVNDINARFPNDAIWVLGPTDTDPIKQTKNLWDGQPGSELQPRHDGLSRADEPGYQPQPHDGRWPG